MANIFSHLNSIQYVLLLPPNKLENWFLHILLKDTGEV